WISSCSIFPQTRAGEVSFDARTSEERRGFRGHCGALEREVAVRRMSGCRITRFDWEVISILGGEVLENAPRTLMVSPGWTGVSYQSSNKYMVRGEEWSLDTWAWRTLHQRPFKWESETESTVQRVAESASETERGGGLGLTG